MCGGTSVATGSDTIVHFGLGSRTTIDTLTVVWPSGITQVLENVAADKLITIREPAA
jgi:hypothetical protein